MKRKNRRFLEPAVAPTEGVANLVGADLTELEERVFYAFGAKTIEASVDEVFLHLAELADDGAFAWHEEKSNVQTLWVPKSLTVAVVEYLKYPDLVAQTMIEYFFQYHTREEYFYAATAEEQVLFLLFLREVYLSDIEGAA